MRRDFHITGIAHITGGGITENLPRILPKQCKAVIRTSSWTPPPVFQFLQREGNLSFHEMMRTFNNGLGLIMVVSEKQTAEALSRLNGLGETAFHIGSVESRAEKEEPIEFV